MTEVLGIVKDGNLIPEQTWKELVGSIENRFDNLETNLQRAKRELAKKIEDSMKRRINLKKNFPKGNFFSNKFGIMFSGGVDSTLIAFLSKKLNADFTCYSVGMEKSEDLKWAREITDFYNFKLKIKILNNNELEIVLRDVIKILGTTDIVSVSVGAVGYAASKMALNDGINVIFSGLGSEEIFAGYKRHEDAFGENNFESLHRECWNGLKGMWSRDLIRDFKIGKSLGVKLMVPFLDKEVIKYAMQIHPMFKIDKENKKVILRYAAESLGLKKEFAWRKKKAAQYGSAFVKGMDKLAAAKGFKYKKDYLESLKA